MTYNANPGSGQTNYTSARLKSLPTTGMGPYGQFDFVAQNPSAVGMGAAIWSMGASNNTRDPVALVRRTGHDGDSGAEDRQS